MRIFASLLTFALLAIPAAGVFSQDMYGTGVYASAGGGVSLMGETELAKDKHKGVPGASEDVTWGFDTVGFGAGGAVGYDFGDFRADAEFSYLSAGFRHGGKVDENNKADDTLTVMAIMANGFFDLDTGTPFFPYIGIGAGAVNLSVTLKDDETSQFDGTGWGFGYQANLGVAYQVIDEIALTLGYKFFGTLETPVEKDKDNYVKPMLMAHRAELGVRFSF